MSDRRRPIGPKRIRIGTSPLRHFEPSEAPESGILHLARVFGEIMWEWSCIETELFHIFASASGMAWPQSVADSERERSLSQSFFAVKGIEIRIQMTHAVAQGRWEKGSPNFIRWAEIHEWINEQRKVRGRLGHRTGVVIPDPQKKKGELVIMIEPPSHADFPRTYEEAKNRGLNKDMLEEIALEFTQLRLVMASFSLSLQHEGQREASEQPVSDRPRPRRSRADRNPREP
jgi:hypothetical protein